MATRDEVKSDNQSLKTELKEDINKVGASLTDKIDKVEQKIDRVDSKFDRLQWLIISTIVVVLLKDQILGLFSFVIAK